MRETEEYVESLSPLNIQFKRHVEQTPQALQQLTFQNVNNPLVASAGDFEVNGWPQFISSAVKHDLVTFSKELPKLLIKLVAHELENNTENFKKCFACDVDLIAQALQQNVADYLLCRGDLVHSNGAFKVLELNVGSNLGGSEIKFFEQKFREIPVVASFLNHGRRVTCRDPMTVMLQAISRAALDRNLVAATDAVNLAFLITKEAASMGTAVFMQGFLSHVAQSIGANFNFVFITELDELSFQDNKVYYRTQPVHCFVSPGRNWGEEELGFDQRLLQAFHSGSLMLPENPLSQLLGDKRLLGLLWEKRSASCFNDEERSLIDTYIIRSASGKEKTLHWYEESLPIQEFLSTHKNNLVIKPGKGAQGNSVYVGRFCSDAKWLSAAATAIETGLFVIQEYCESQPVIAVNKAQMGEYNSVWGVFSLGANYGGSWLRMAEEHNAKGDGIINVSKGAMEGIIFEDLS